MENFLYVWLTFRYDYVITEVPEPLVVAEGIGDPLIGNPLGLIN